MRFRHLGECQTGLRDEGVRGVGELAHDRPDLLRREGLEAEGRGVERPPHRAAAVHPARGPPGGWHPSRIRPCASSPSG
eukprot:6800818-Alexandrium_andersonii.AAC.1